MLAAIQGEVVIKASFSLSELKLGADEPVFSKVLPMAALYPNSDIISQNKRLSNSFSKSFEKLFLEGFLKSSTCASPALSEGKNYRNKLLNDYSR